MLEISRRVSIPDGEVEMTAVRSRGAGGQNVNKVATAVHLRFDIAASSLPALYKERLLRLEDRRITADGVVVIKAGRHRTRERNREEALERLRDLIRSVGAPRRARRPTTPTAASRRKRLEGKTRRGRVKRLRKPPAGNERE